MRFIIVMGVVLATSPALGTGASRAVVLASPHDETAKASEIRWIEVGSSGLRNLRTLTIPHAAGAVVRGDLVPNQDAVVVLVDEAGARDPECGAVLFRSGTNG